MGIHRRKEDFLEKKKDVMYLLSYLKDQFGKELVVAIIPVISSKKENHF